MARGGKAEWFPPNFWTPVEKSLFVKVYGNEPRLLRSNEFQMMYHVGLWEISIAPYIRQSTLEQLFRRSLQEGVDFVEKFNWKRYRTWYKRNRR